MCCTFGGNYNMLKEGIIGPTKVVRSALQNASSVPTLRYPIRDIRLAGSPPFAV